MPVSKIKGMFCNNIVQNELKKYPNLKKNFIHKGAFVGAMSMLNSGTL